MIYPGNRLQTLFLALATAFALSIALSAQEAPTDPLASMQFNGIPEDWSTRRVIYTQNGSNEDMMAVRGNPRFLHSFLIHNMREHGSQIRQAAARADSFFSGAGPLVDPANEDRVEGRNFRVDLPERDTWRRSAQRRSVKSKVDWAISLGPQFGMAIGETPAKYSFNPAAAPTCTTVTPPSVGDFIVYSLKATPAKGSQANLVGLTNLYSGTSPTGYCGTVPTFLFSYAIGSGGSLLSPVLSLDGKKVAWVENSSAGHAVLHITTWVVGQGTNATSGSVAVGSGSSDVAIDYTDTTNTSCTAGVGANRNTNSEIYVDYGTDTAFVGADNGVLYHLKGVFKGTPTFDFCAIVNSAAGTALSGGIYDDLLSPPEFFIADSQKLYAYTVGATSFSLKASVTYGAGKLTGPGPILDAFNNFIYVFSAADTESPSHASVTQLPTSLASSVVVPLGPASTNVYNILFDGTFDNHYYTNGPKSATSTLYTCGTDPALTTAQALYAIKFNPATGLANTTPAMSANTNVNPGGKNGTCSPISEFYDGTTDRIFVGMGQHTASSGANVVQMWNVTTQLTSAATSYTAQATGYFGGPGGLTIDNSANPTIYPQAESVYFSTLVCSGASSCGANNCCAVKLTQSLLK